MGPEAERKISTLYAEVWRPFAELSSFGANLYVITVKLQLIYRKFSLFTKRSPNCRNHIT